MRSWPTACSRSCASWAASIPPTPTTCATRASPSRLPVARAGDSLSEGAGDEEGIYSLILANPPFAGSLDYETTVQNLLRVAKTKKTELLFLEVALRLFKPGGPAAVIVPDGVLFGSAKAHMQLRRILVEDQKLDAIVKLPSGVFKPYVGVSTAIPVFIKTESGGTDRVWFCEVKQTAGASTTGARRCWSGRSSDAFPSTWWSIT